MSTMAAPEPVVAVVRVAKPWYAPRFVVVGRMRDTIEQYAHVPGLEFKAYSFERSSGDYGGVYVWKDRAAAQAWFDAAWHARVQKERGVPGRVTLYDAPVSVDNSYGALGSVSEGSAVVTVVQLPLPPGAERFEFQMLYGVRRDLQERIVKEGWRMRVYVPFGTQWYPYLMRRLAERPANLAFITGNVMKEMVKGR